VTQRFCKCVIKCIGDTVLTRPYQAIIHKEDVRATEKDSVEMIKSFRPGDIILARVVSFSSCINEDKNLRTYDPLARLMQ
jgi:exosome complex RNA-binding protein Csl4